LPYSAVLNMIAPTSLLTFTDERPAEFLKRETLRYRFRVGVKTGGYARIRARLQSCRERPSLPPL
jgi:hypothetical protein